MPTLCLNIGAGVKVLEHKDVNLALIAHEIEPLLTIMLEIHGRAHVVSSDMIGFDKIVAIYGAAITNR